MNFRVIALISVIIACTVAYALPIKETKSNEPVEIYTSPSGTPAKAVTVSGTSGLLTALFGAMIDGSTDVVQLRVQAAVGQTAKTFQVENSSAEVGFDIEGAQISSSRAGAAAGNSANQFFNRARGTLTSKTIVADGDIIGSTRWAGWDGAGYEESAGIFATVNGTPGTDDMPGALSFRTTPDGGVTPVDRMLIENDGEIAIGTPTATFPFSGYVLRALGDADSEVRIGIAAYGLGATAALNTIRARGTIGTPTVVSASDNILTIGALAYDGNSYETAAQIQLDVGGTPGDGDMPGRIEFHTTPDGSTSVAMVAYLTPDGSFLMGTGSGADTVGFFKTTTTGTTTCKAACSANEPASMDNSSGLCVGAWRTDNFDAFNQDLDLNCGDATNVGKKCLCIGGPN